MTRFLLSAAVAVAMVVGLSFSAGAAEIARFGGLVVKNDAKETRYTCNLGVSPKWVLRTKAKAKVEVCRIEGMCFALVEGATGYVTGNYYETAAVMPGGVRKPLPAKVFQATCSPEICADDTDDTKILAACLTEEAADNGSHGDEFLAPPRKP